MAPFTYRLRVYIEDTDLGGIVYYVNYLKFMERARTELLRELGFEQTKLRSAGVIFVVHSLDSRYLKPAQLDDELNVETVIEQASAATLAFRQNVARLDGTLLCSACVKVATVAADSLKPTRTPRPLVEALAPYLPSNN
ncbi:tol-pal system-associated acyl-CoA thioesterase [Motiliproteus sp. SC1-56]|uniref:tol-pal system-associated acyl-CoA thioesterase n=1 Tax=Motiliproteus sp. SC1-56 TaxID=2799565 RepID=UPI001A8D0E57|nr:tol-pal system-associated acyl-CoA thioesterase [Motiliproteus sp. SC1-56]